MPFCSTCGNQLAANERFCGSCGSEQNNDSNSCRTCGKGLDENEKFCPDCGTSATGVPKPESQAKRQAEPELQEDKFTKEGRKIISGGPKPNQNQQVTTAPPSPKLRSKKKKRGCFGCLISGVIILLILVLLFIGIRFIISKISSIPESKSDSISLIYPGDENNLVVPGGQTKRNKNNKPFENEELKELTNELESIFRSSDIEKLKLILSETAMKNYGDDFEKLKPLMPSYAKAFKNRKLITSTDFFKVYEFTGDNGETYTATFEYQPGGSWKLTRF